MTVKLVRIWVGMKGDGTDLSEEEKEKMAYKAMIQLPGSPELVLCAGLQNPSTGNTEFPKEHSA